MNNEYFRKFITLSHENGQSGTSFGTAILEHRNGINKITVSLSKIRPNVTYCLILVKTFDKSAKFVETLTFKSDKLGNAYCKDEVSNKTLENINLCDFDVCAIKIHDTNELITPLVGYLNDKVNWRQFYIKPEPKQNEKLQYEEPNETENSIHIKSKPYEFGFNTEKNTKNFETEAINNAEIITPVSKRSIKIKKPDILKNYKLQPVKQKKSSIEVINTLDDFEYKDDNIKVKTESDVMLDNLKSEIQNLKELALKSYKIETKCAFEDLLNLPCTLSEIFNNSDSIVPLKNNVTNIDWVIIDYSDLPMIDTDYRFTKNPFIRNSYKKFSHFILGKCVEDGNDIYMLGVPDFFNHEYEENIRNLGFISFKESTIGTQQGYWLIVL